MASLILQQDGLKRIEFGPGGHRRKVRLGRMSTKKARRFLVRVEHTIEAGPDGPFETDVKDWLAAMDDITYGRLERAGLVRPRNQGAAILKTFLADALAALQVKPQTLSWYKHAERCLLECFGEDKPIGAIDARAAESFRQWLRDHEHLAAATIARRVKAARWCFKRGVMWGLLDKNPFADVEAGGMTNQSRQRFIDRDTTAKLLEAAPNAEWRALIALARYGGVRIPSELVGLKWADINWGGGRMRITSPKTERHQGQHERLVPLYPELEPYLTALYSQAEPGAEYVFSRKRATGKVNLRTYLQKIIRKAGLTPWPRLWGNLRATRSTELFNANPAHIAAAWMGHSPATAAAHYLQIRDDDYMRAAGKLGDEQGTDNTKAARNPAHRQAEVSGNKGNAHEGDLQETSANAGDSACCQLSTGSESWPARIRTSTLRTKT